jgi:phosphatidate cytidylyltransferase
MGYIESTSPQRIRKQSAMNPSEIKPVDNEKPRKLISRNFSLRAISAIILLPVVVYILYVGGAIFAVMILFAVIVGSLEYTMIVSRNHLSFQVIVCVLDALIVAITFPIGSPAIGFAAMALSAALVTLYQVNTPSETRPLASVGQALLMWGLALYMGFVGAFGIMLRSHMAGLLWWTLIACGTWTMDTLSYAGGRAYGRHLLVPQLSPSKTVEGAVTGIAAAIILSMLLLMQIHLLTPLAVVLAISAPFAALIGDLFESSIKRRFGVKDSHMPGFNIIPGHGGLLDRIDGLMLVVICYFFIIAAAQVASS